MAALKGILLTMSINNMKGIFLTLLATLFAAGAATGVIMMYAIAIIIDNAKWILLCGTALLIASWYA